MSKENLENVINNIISGDFEKAKSEFSSHVSQKSKAILNPPKETDSISTEED
jgi:hypothetical protein